MSHPDRDGGERRNGKVNWQAVGVFVAVLFAGLAFAQSTGADRTKVEGLETRVGRLEGLVADVAVLKAQVQYLYETEIRRQTRGQP